MLLFGGYVHEGGVEIQTKEIHPNDSLLIAAGSWPKEATAVASTEKSACLSVCRLICLSAMPSRSVLQIKQNTTERRRSTMFFGFETRARFLLWETGLF